MPNIERSHKWDLRFLRLARFWADECSKDPSTKTGAILVRPNQTIASIGYNGFAQGMQDTPEMYIDREVKYARVVHCEMNAVLYCRDPLPLVGYTLYTTGPSCDRCAVHMIQSGIRRFVFVAPDEGQRQRWNVEKTMGYFREVNAEVIELSQEEVFGKTLPLSV